MQEGLQFAPGRVSRRGRDEGGTREGCKRNEGGTWHKLGLDMAVQYNREARGGTREETERNKGGRGRNEGHTWHKFGLDMAAVMYSS
jgi:hypothetical protein